MIKVENTIKIYEIAGSEEDANGKEVVIRSHWNRNEMVCIEIPDEGVMTVCASDLEKAIRNATNTR